MHLAAAGMQWLAPSCSRSRLALQASLTSMPPLPAHRQHSSSPACAQPLTPKFKGQAGQAVLVAVAPLKLGAKRRHLRQGERQWFSARARLSQIVTSSHVGAAYWCKMQTALHGRPVQAARRRNAPTLRWLEKHRHTHALLCCKHTHTQNLRPPRGTGPCGGRMQSPAGPAARAAAGWSAAAEQGRGRPGCGR